jgi:hypothetical protein
VGSREIHPEDLLAEAEHRRRDGRPVPEKEALLEEMIGEESLVQQAVALGLNRDPDMQRTWRAALIGTLKGRKLEPGWNAVTVTPAEIQAYYEAHQAAYARPEQARIGMIFAAIPSQAPEEAKAPVRSRIEAARALALANPDGFKQAASQYSDHQASRYRSGDVGWVLRGHPPTWLPGTVAETAFSLPEGAVSEILTDKTGLYLVTRLEHRPAGMRPIAEVESTIRETLAKQRREELSHTFFAAAREAARPEIFPTALEAVSLPADSSPPPAAGPPSFLPSTVRK